MSKNTVMQMAEQNFVNKLLKSKAEADAGANYNKKYFITFFK